MFRLWSNGPKELVECVNYTFDDHFRRPTPSYQLTPPPPRIKGHGLIQCLGTSLLFGWPCIEGQFLASY
jgi:hypothetical protein